MSLFMILHEVKKEEKKKKSIENSMGRNPEWNGIWCVWRKKRFSSEV